MLIKSKRLPKTMRLREVTSETAREAELEIRKARQEARLIKGEAEAILVESQKKLNEAEEKVKQIIKEANAKASELKDTVYKETILSAKKEAEEIKNKSKQLLKELFDVKREALNQAHNEIIKVALDLASKIIKYQASIDPNVLKTQVVESIKKATTEADRVQVFVNPVDLETLKQSIPDMEKLFPSGVDIVPLPDDSVDQGSCAVETKSGQLDARFSTQLVTLTNLVTSLEIPSPQITIEEDIVPLIQVVEPIIEEEVLSSEEEKLKEELLGESPLIDLIREENSLEEEAPMQRKKKLFTEGLVERTIEEIEELDEESEEDNEILEEEIMPKSVLKPKKKSPNIQNTQIKSIAEEVEQSPEWKDLVQEEDEE